VFFLPCGQGGCLFPLPSVAASLMPLRAVAGCPSRVRSTALARLALDGRSAMVQAFFSEWRTDADRENSLPFVVQANLKNGVTAKPSLSPFEYPPLGGFRYLCTGIVTRNPSVNSVTYGVSYGFQKALLGKALTLWIVPKGANLGSERCESGFRKVRTKITCGWFLIVRISRFLIVRT